MKGKVQTAESLLSKIVTALNLVNWESLNTLTNKQKTNKKIAESLKTEKFNNYSHIGVKKN